MSDNLLSTYMEKVAERNEGLYNDMDFFYLTLNLMKQCRAMDIGEIWKICPKTIQSQIIDFVLGRDGDSQDLIDESRGLRETRKGYETLVNWLIMEDLI